MKAEHGFRLVSLFVSEIMAILAAHWVQFGHFGKMNQIITPNYFHGTGMAAFIGVE